MIRTLEIGGLVIPVQAAGEIEQSYEELGGTHIGRKMSGAAYSQVHWSKIATRISGRGWVPPGLASLRSGTQYLLKCVDPRVIQEADNVIVIPAARRSGSDYAPTGFAVVAGRYVSTPVAMATDTATLTAVSGAQGYGVRYWPEITVYASFSSSGTPGAASWSWTIDAEEV